MKQSIGVWSYEAEYAELRDQILAACDRVFKSNRLVLGEEVRAFEQAMARNLGVAGTVGVNSGTDAIYIALAGVGIGTDDEVITVPNTAVPTVSAISTLGARPVFVDVNDDFLMNVTKIEAAITPKTRAILPVHLYGQCVDMDPLLEIAQRHNLKVVEDVAQAQGAHYKGRQAGSMGHAAAFSFYPTKILGAYGDGGLVASNDPGVIELVRTLRFYGMRTTYYSEHHGYNSRLDEVQAAILSLKLPLVEGWIARRREIAARYTDAFANTRIRAPNECSYGRHAFYLYVVEHPDRDAVLEKLAQRNINCNVSYRWPIHTMRGYEYLNYKTGEFPIVEKKAAQIFSLPMYPHLSNDEVSEIIGAVREIA